MRLGGVFERGFEGERWVRGIRWVAMGVGFREWHDDSGGSTWGKDGKGGGRGGGGIGTVPKGKQEASEEARRR